MMVVIVFTQVVEDHLIIAISDLLGMESVVFQELDQTVILDSIGMDKNVFF